jgi:hypothetical protein
MNYNWKHTPGKWSTCNPRCKCMQVSGEHDPIAKIESGEWGDTYPAIRLKKDSHQMYGMEAEAYIEMCSYGNIPEETAWANVCLIAAAPEMLKVCERVMEFQDVWLSEGNNHEEIELLAMAGKVIAALVSSKEE